MYVCVYKRVLGLCTRRNRRVVSVVDPPSSTIAVFPLVQRSLGGLVDSRMSMCGSGLRRVRNRLRLRTCWCSVRAELVFRSGSLGAEMW